MKKAYFKNLFRDIRKTPSRFLSIIIIIAVGVAFYGGVRATSPDMKMSGDLYFRKNNLMDFKLLSTLGLTKGDIAEIRKIKDISGAEGAYSLDAVIEREGHLKVLNINSLPQSGGINEIKIEKGRRPGSINEALVEDGFLEDNKLNIGDTIVLKSGNESKIEDRLKSSRFKIAGAAKSPLYISAQRQLSSLGNGTVGGFVYLLPEAFKDEVYTEAYVTIKRNESKSSLLNNEEYNSAVKSVEAALKDLGAKRSRARYDEIIKKGTAGLKTAENELNRAMKDASDKFAAAQSQIKSGRNRITTGWQELEKNETLFNLKMAEGMEKIEDGKRKMLIAEAAINSRAKEIQKGKLLLEDGKRKLNDGERRINLGKQQAAKGIASGIYQRVQEARGKLEENPFNPIYRIQYNMINGMYEKYIRDKNFDTMYNELKKGNMLDNIKPYFDMEALKAEEAKIAEGRSKLLKTEKAFKEGETRIKSARREIEDKKKELSSAESKLNIQKQEGLRKLKEGKNKLQKSETELNKNAVKLLEKIDSANKGFEEAASKIEENRIKLKDIKRSDWYALGRSMNIGYETYRQDSNRIESIGRVFPLLFFLVAALVCLTTMTRMVQDKRIEIGTLKALGYSNTAVIAHFVIYAFSASIIGSLIGISAGFRIFPPLIMNAYASLYSIPYRVAPFNMKIALQASAVAIFFITSAAVLAAFRELREVPASLMRPKSPGSGKGIFIEKINYIWKKLSFTGKVTARNIFRYKQRLFMTITGIAACTALIIMGFGLREGITGSAKTQFNKVYKYNMQSSLWKNVSEAEKNDMKKDMMKNTNVKSIMFAYSRNALVKTTNSNTQEACVIVPENSGALEDFIDLSMHNRDIGLMDEGIIITEKLSRLINKKVGDTVEMTLDDRNLKAKILGITEHYIQHFIYMSPSYYKRLTGKRPVYNSLYGLLKNTSDKDQENTSKELKKINNINFIAFKNNINMDFDRSLESVNSVVWVLIASAGVLAFVVMYNLTNINITERKRELATIKLLGFYNSELASYIYKENIILTIIGSFAGIFLGIALNRYILLSAETNVIMFMNKISPIYFLYAVLLTLVFSLTVNLAMYKRFDKIDMIESLKSVE